MEDISLIRTPKLTCSNGQHSGMAWQRGHVTFSTQLFYSERRSQLHRTVQNSTEFYAWINSSNIISYFFSVEICAMIRNDS